MAEQDKEQEQNEPKERYEDLESKLSMLPQTKRISHSNFDSVTDYEGLVALSHKLMPENPLTLDLLYGGKGDRPKTLAEKKDAARGLDQIAEKELRQYVSKPKEQAEVVEYLFEKQDNPDELIDIVSELYSPNDLKVIKEKIEEEDEKIQKEMKKGEEADKKAIKESQERKQGLIRERQKKTNELLFSDKLQGVEKLLYQYNVFSKIREAAEKGDKHSEEMIKSLVAQEYEKKAKETGLLYFRALTHLTISSPNACKQTFEVMLEQIKQGIKDEYTRKEEVKGEDGKKKPKQVFDKQRFKEKVGEIIKYGYTEKEIPSAYADLAKKASGIDKIEEKYQEQEKKKSE